MTVDYGYNVDVHIRLEGTSANKHAIVIKSAFIILYFGKNEYRVKKIEGLDFSKEFNMKLVGITSNSSHPNIMIFLDFSDYGTYVSDCNLFNTEVKLTTSVTIFCGKL
jgi:hypothetical protein